MRRVIRGLVPLVIVSSLLVGCGESSTGPVPAELTVTRITLALSAPFSGPQTVFIDDPDGMGPLGASAQVGSLVLQRNVPYTGTVTFENRSVTPTTNVTDQVQREASRHRVFFTVTGSGVTVEPSDVDPQGFTLGLRVRANVLATPTPGVIGVLLCRYGATEKPALATSCTGATETNVGFVYTIAP
jgi:hypothetical protein